MTTPKRYFLEITGGGVGLCEEDPSSPLSEHAERYYFCEDIDPLITLLRDYRAALEDGPENCSLRTAEALEERLDALLPKDTP